jgi:hypothetical protein
MKANPDKFQAIAIGNKSHSENISFNLKGNIIKCEDEVKIQYSYRKRVIIICVVIQRTVLYEREDINKKKI